jgi:nucleosome binding factor SPN SPT16 subunit
VEDGEFDSDTSKSIKISLSKLNVYPDKVLPKLNKKEIHVDEKREVVLFPINKKLVPVHAHCIKNVTKHNERGFYSLRVNFQTPAQGTGGLEFPSLVNGTSPLYIKELTFKSSNNESI